MSQTDGQHHRHRLIVRQIREDDIEEIVQVARLGFGNPNIAFRPEYYRSHLKIFPEGQICVEYNGKIVGSCSSLIVNYDDYGDDHTFREITGNGFITNHNPNGKTLYGIDVVVHPDYRYLKIGRRLYEARRRLCQRLNLKNIMFGGRIPNYHKYADQMTAEEYVEKVQQQKIYDPVLVFQLMNGFKVVGVKANYLTTDDASLNYATLMRWDNVDYVPESKFIAQHSQPVGIGVIQYQLREIKNLKDFQRQCEYFIHMCSKKRMDFAVLPESFTWQLLSFLGGRVPRQQLEKVKDFTEEYTKFFSDLAIRYNINIVAGSHFVETKEELIYNMSYLFHRHGKVDRQAKIHLTTDERKWLGLEAGKQLHVFDTDCGKVAILIGYDIVFPELARIAVDQGAKIIFTPFTAQDEQEYLRIRYCAQARAIENQVYTVITGMVGHLPHVHHLNTQYSHAAIFSPVDISFSDSGIIRESKANTEMILFGEVDLEKLRRHRLLGPETPLLNRRLDIYSSNNI